MRDVAGVDHEGGVARQSLHAVNRLLQRAGGIRVLLFVEADMAVADLQEGEPLLLSRDSLIDNAERGRYAASHGPQHTRARPGHAFQYFAPARAAVLIIICRHRQSPANGFALTNTRLIKTTIYSRMKLHHKDVINVPVCETGIFCST